LVTDRGLSSPLCLHQILATHYIELGYDHVEDHSLHLVAALDTINAREEELGVQVLAIEQRSLDVLKKVPTKTREAILVAMLPIYTLHATNELKEIVGGVGELPSLAAAIYKIYWEIIVVDTED
jgi:Mg/Co/Ni transporter MgtE